MIGIVVTQQVVAVVITPAGQPALVVGVPAPPSVVIQPVGLQGPPGPASALTAGAGLSIVGNEIRMAIGALPVAG
jgi:hypothetical protein